MNLAASKCNRTPRIAWLVLGVIIVLGAFLRIIALDKVPPGLAPDEATNGYDAYSLLLTGRDQHGIFLPLVMRSFNDYRMPLFIYSLIPVIGIFGLTSTVVRLGAALWGILTIPVIYWLGYRIKDAYIGLVAALLLAISPWHLPFSRIGLEMTLITFVLTLSLALMWEWHVRQQRGWLIAACLALGVTIYTYSTAKLLIPAFIGLLAVCWYKELWANRRTVFVCLVVILCLTLPMLYLTVKYNEPMQARYNQIAIFRPERPWLESALEAVRLFTLHFSPGYLFIHGDLDTLQHPPFGGQLYWVQAPLLVLGLWKLRKKPYRPALLFLLGWLCLAAIPPALTTPNLPGSAHASRNLTAVIPFQILTALGVDWIRCNNRFKKVIRTTVLICLGIALLGNAAWYLHQYFFEYAAQVAPRFDDGMQTVIETMDRLDDDSVPLVVFSSRVSWPYIYVLFFTRYDPVQLHADLPVRSTALFAPVTKMGKYIVVDDLEEAYAMVEHGLFIGPLDSLPNVPETAIIRRPANGEPFCKIVSK
jgi:4-amino-4-deoxy-L-arabinose transferase-like glycosyltransferase